MYIMFLNIECAQTVDHLFRNCMVLWEKEYFLTSNLLYIRNVLFLVQHTIITILYIRSEQNGNGICDDHLGLIIFRTQCGIWTQKAHDYDKK